MTSTVNKVVSGLTLLLLVLLGSTCSEDLFDFPNNGEPGNVILPPYCSQIQVNVDKDSGLPSTVTTCYDPKEIVSNTTGFSPQAKANLFQYLQDAGFKIKDTCICEEELTLWTSVSGPIGPGLIGIIDQAPPDPSNPVGSGSGLSLNYFNLEMPRTVITGNNDPKPPYPDLPTNPKARVTVGVVDAGTIPHPGLLALQRGLKGPICQTSLQDHELGLDMWNYNTPAPIDVIGHGVFVNGVVAGAVPPPILGDNGIAIELVNAKVTEDNGLNIDLFKAVCGLYYVAEQGAKVINLSWGYTATEAPKVMFPFLAEAEEMGIVLSAGAGNTGQLMKDPLFWPAAFSKYSYPPGQNTVIAVGAYDVDKNKLASISAYGDLQVDIAAPGKDVISFYLNNGTGRMTGTSVATAYVTRTAAILRGLNSRLTSRQIKECIINNSPPAPTGLGNAFPTIPLLKHQAVIDACK